MPTSLFEEIDSPNIRWEFQNGNPIGIRTKNGSVGFNGGNNISLSSGNTAAQNTALIQAALNAQGIVTLAGSGIAQINPIYVSKNTQLIQAANLILKLADNTNAPMITNSSCHMTINPANIALVGGVLTITAPGHSYSVGQQIYCEDFLGNTSLNGPQTITAITATSYSFANGGSVPTNVGTSQYVFTSRYNPIPAASFVRASNLVTVSEANHTRLNGDHVYIAGLATDTSFNGAVEIVSTVRNVSWTYASTGANGSPTGTAQVLGDNNITLDLKELDYNRANNTNLNYDNNGNIIMLGNLGNSKISVANALDNAIHSGFIYNAGYCDFPIFRSTGGVVNLQFESACNGITCGDISAIGGADDILAWGVSSSTGIYANVAAPCGSYSMGTLYVNSINGQSVTACFKSYAYTGYDLGEIIINSVAGVSPLQHGDPTAGIQGGTCTSLIVNSIQTVPPVNVNQVTITSGLSNTGYLKIGDFAGAATGSGYDATIGATIGTLDIANFLKSAVTTGISILIGGTINDLRIGTFKEPLGTSGTVYGLEVLSTGTVKNLMIDKLEFTASNYTTGAAGLQIAGAVNNLLINQMIIDHIEFGIYQASTAAAGTYSIGNLISTNVVQDVQLNVGATDLHIGYLNSSLYYANLSGYAIAVASGAGISIKIDKVSQNLSDISSAAQEWKQTIYNGGTNLKLYAPMLATDLTLLNNKTIKNAECIHNGNNAAGTIAAGHMCICNGTNWLQKDLPANLY